MTTLNNYGVVYTPDTLAKFAAKLLLSETPQEIFDTNQGVTVLDPACGEGILLKEFLSEFCLHYEQTIRGVGIDVENAVVDGNKKRFPEKST